MDLAPIPFDSVYFPTLFDNLSTIQIIVEPFQLYSYFTNLYFKDLITFKTVAPQFYTIVSYPAEVFFANWLISLQFLVYFILGIQEFH